jgi:hypothetical protein
MRVGRTVFSLSPLLLTNFALSRSRLEIAGAGSYRTLITNDHLDFPKLGGFGTAFQDAAGEFLRCSRQPDQGQSLPPMQQRSRKNKGDSR